MQPLRRLNSLFTPPKLPWTLSSGEVSPASSSLPSFVTEQEGSDDLQQQLVNSKREVRAHKSRIAFLERKLESAESKRVELERALAFAEGEDVTDLERIRSTLIEIRDRVVDLSFEAVALLPENVLDKVLNQRVVEAVREVGDGSAWRLARQAQNARATGRDCLVYIVQAIICSYLFDSILSKFHPSLLRESGSDLLFELYEELSAISRFHSSHPSSSHQLIFVLPPGPTHVARWRSLTYASLERLPSTAERLSLPSKLSSSLLNPISSLFSILLPSSVSPTPLIARLKPATVSLISLAISWQRLHRLEHLSSDFEAFLPPSFHSNDGSAESYFQSKEMDSAIDGGGCGKERVIGGVGIGLIQIVRKNENSGSTAKRNVILKAMVITEGWLAGELVNHENCKEC